MQGDAELRLRAGGVRWRGVRGRGVRPATGRGGKPGATTWNDLVRGRARQGRVVAHGFGRWARVAGRQGITAGFEGRCDRFGRILRLTDGRRRRCRSLVLRHGGVTAARDRERDPCDDNQGSRAPRCSPSRSRCSSPTTDFRWATVVTSGSAAKEAFDDDGDEDQVVDRNARRGRVGTRCPGARGLRRGRRGIRRGPRAGGVVCGRPL